MTASENPTLIRQWLLLKSLASRKYGMTIAEMAHETGVVERTIRRDLNVLQQAGFPIRDVRVSAHGRRHWSLETENELHDLKFNWDEAIALYFARRHLDPLAGTVLWTSLASAFKKIRASMSEGALHHLERMQDAFHFIQFGTSCYDDKAEMIDQLSIAVEDNLITLISYQSRTATEPVTYEVTPYGVIYYRHSLYFIAYSHDHETVRIFKVDRLESVELTQLKSQRPPDFDLAQYFEHSFGIFPGAGNIQTVKIRFAPRLARIITESRWHPSQSITHNSDGSVILTLELADLTEVKSWILSFGPNAIVLEPPQLREEIIAELTQSLAQLTEAPTDSNVEIPK